MSIRLHHTVFRALANWAPGAPEGETGADMLMAVGGITVPTLRLLHRYACHLAGVDEGSAAMFYVDGPGGTSVQFGDSENTGLGVEGETYTLVTMSLHDPVTLFYSPPGGSGGDHGTHRLEYPDGGPITTELNALDLSFRLEKQFSTVLSGVPFRWLQAVPR